MLTKSWRWLSALLLAAGFSISAQGTMPIKAQSTTDHSQLEALRGLREMIAVLAWSPASGRPARFLSAKSAQATLKANAVQQLAEQAGLPSLCEYVVGQFIALYAHSETDVVLLAIKHQRQLMYSAES